MHKKILSLILLAALAFPAGALALEMPSDGNSLASSELFTAHSYVVVDKATGDIVLSKDADSAWVPASLTKLVTALVVLDTSPKLSQAIAMSKSDEVGGARIATKSGVKYTVGDLFHASIVASANNATNALARSTGLPREQFVEKMNQKAAELGATHTYFYEPTGIDERNKTTATDYVKITKAAYGNPYVAKLAQVKSYTFKSTNNKRYSHTVKNTNKLLGDSELGSVSGKTGYLEESLYNFTADVKDRMGNNFIIVLLGSKSSSSQFGETKRLAFLASLSKAFFAPKSGSVLGASTSETGGLTMSMLMASNY